MAVMLGRSLGGGTIRRVRNEPRIPVIPELNRKARKHRIKSQRRNVSRVLLMSKFDRRRNEMKMAMLSQRCPSKFHFRCWRR